MSQTFELVCHETRQKLWVGQGWGKMTSLYTSGLSGPRLKRFLSCTKGKQLILLCTDTDDGEWHEYEDFI